ncbi:MAG: hypothetical protein GEU88_11395 [Solirubrobacterales bacterium]|nr:hypothetical protein [Solirubrobacterales bacterium]
MNRLRGLRPTPALLIALAALVVAMSGAAVALPGKGTVTTNDIRKGAVETKNIAKRAVKGKNLAEDSVKKRHVARGAIGSRQIKGKSIRGNRLKEGAIKWKQIADHTITAKQIADATITGKQVADATITARQIAAGTITASQIAAGTITGTQIADGTITAKQVAPNGLSTRNLSDMKLIGEGGANMVRVSATNGADIGEAAAAAPEIELYRKGQLTLYGKCMRATETNEVFSDIYVKTTANGAIFEGPQGERTGGNAASDFLNVGTPEDLRTVASVAIIGAEAEMNDGVFNVIGADGTHLSGDLMAAAKNGALAGGNGVYGDGNVCLFGGTVNG